MIVSAASRMSSAISFGVFWRLAPSTIEIIRSRKASPGFAVIRMTSQSESTRVPPVTALRSPPPDRGRDERLADRRGDDRERGALLLPDAEERVHDPVDGAEQ